MNKIHVYDDTIHPCTACGHCRDVFGCVFDDCMAPLYEKIRDSDAVIISSPVYFSSLPGQLKNLIDRCQVLWEQKERDKNSIRAKFGFLILTAGSNYKDAFRPSFTISKHFFHTLRASFDKSCCIFLPGVDTINELAPAMIESYKKTSEEFLKKMH